MPKSTAFEIYRRKAEELAARNNVRLAYLTMFGSHLYGTDTEKSDLDLKGLFLPSVESLVLQNSVKSLHFSTGNEHSRNSSEDVDIELWSLQYWLLKLVPSGDTGALDLFFSPSHAKCVIFRDPCLDAVFDSPERLLDLKNNQAYVGYAIGQAKKYGIKGSRLGAIKHVQRWLEAAEDRFSQEPDLRLGAVMDEILRDCGSKYCAEVTDNSGKRCIQLCGKLHTETIRLTEFRNRVDSDMARYGARANDAEQNNGIDYKAMSHAIRAIDQMEELLTTGRVNFPLKTREGIMAVKRGEFTWQEMEPMVLERLAQIEALQAECGQPHRYDADFAREVLLNCYGLQPEESEQGSPVP